MSPVEQEPPTLPEHMSSSPVFSGVRVTRSLDMCMFCRSLSFFFWPLCCLPSFDLRILITPLVSSNSHYIWFWWVCFDEFLTNISFRKKITLLCNYNRFWHKRSQKGEFQIFHFFPSNFNAVFLHNDHLNELLIENKKKCIKFKKRYKWAQITKFRIFGR